MPTVKPFFSAKLGKAGSVGWRRNGRSIWSRPFGSVLAGFGSVKPSMSRHLLRRASCHLISAAVKVKQIATYIFRNATGVLATKHADRGCLTANRHLYAGPGEFFFFHLGAPSVGGYCTNCTSGQAGGHKPLHSCPFSLTGPRFLDLAVVPI